MSWLKDRGCHVIAYLNQEWGVWVGMWYSVCVCVSEWLHTWRCMPMCMIDPTFGSAAGQLLITYWLYCFLLTSHLNNYVHTLCRRGPTGHWWGHEAAWRHQRWPGKKTLPLLSHYLLDNTISLFGHTWSTCTRMYIQLYAAHTSIYNRHAKCYVSTLHAWTQTVVLRKRAFLGTRIVFNLHPWQLCGRLTYL